MCRPTTNAKGKKFPVENPRTVTMISIPKTTPPVTIVSYTNVVTTEDSLILCSNFVRRVWFPYERLVGQGAAWKYIKRRLVQGRID